VSLRKGHGSGSNPVYIEVLPPDELPIGSAVPPAVTSGPLARRSNGTFNGTSAARIAGQRSAEVRAEKSRWKLKLTRLLPNQKFLPDDTIAPFVDDAQKWYREACESLARDVGGGQLSPGVTSILETAAMQKCWSNFLNDAGTRGHFAWESKAAAPEIGLPKARVSPRTDLIMTAAQMGNSHRQNYLAAYEVALREAQARARAREHEPYDVGAALRGDPQLKK
jgi:hypothetical protein